LLIFFFPFFDSRISPEDAGLWKDEQIEYMKKIVAFIHAHHAAAGIQLAHAGRKASTYSPFKQTNRVNVPPEEGGWQPIGASPVPWSEKYTVPHEMTKVEIQRVIEDFKAATIRALKANFDVIEIHGAHGYLISSFNSPISNRRTDEYGGSFENRTRVG
jgi:2,4-dienoyl-CoA reductase-like NADH-dependent reductase (Old Yellow Enzyme family)